MKRTEGIEPVSDKGFKHTCSFCGTEQFLQLPYPQRDYVNFYGFLNDAAAAITAAKQKQNTEE